MSKTVAKRSPEMAKMIEASAKGRALMGGTEAMREAGELYLPRFSQETDDNYKARLKASTLFNGVRKTVKDMTGRVFDKPVEITDGPQQIIDMAENIDMQGRDLSVFASEVFKDGFTAGISYIMVDAPRRDGETTRGQAAAMGLRPSMTHLRVEDILGFKTKLYGNALDLSQLRIMETIKEDDPKDPFNQIDEKQVRVLDRIESGGVQVTIWRKGKDETWFVIDEYATEAEEITVISFYAQRTGFFTGEPVLEDLVDVNVSHWQSQSDQRNILHFARVPILFASGRDEDEPITISAGSAITSRNPDADMKWVEHSGKAIDAGRQDLKDLEFQMEALGLQLLINSVQKSATEAANDNVKETSTLAMMADSMKDALEQALQWMAFYTGLGDVSITLNVNKEFGTTMLTAQEVTAMLGMVNAGLLSKATFLEELKRRGFVRPDLDTDAEIDALDAAAVTLQGEALPLNNSALDSALGALNE